MSADDALAAVSDALGSVSDVAQELPDDLPEGKEGGGQGGGADDRGGRGRPGCLTFLLPVTTPGCATWLTFLFLVTTTLAVFTWFWWDPDNVAWRDAIGWPRLAALGLLIIVIPVIVYRLLVLWLEGAPTPFPDLDYAWAEGLHALAVNGLSPGGIPIYLILGSRSETQERALMDATGMRFRVAGVPQGPAPLHWYANSEAIFLFCSDCSWTSALASLRDELVAEALAKSPGASDSLTNYEYIDSTYINTIDPPATTASWNQPPQPTAPNQPTGPLRPTDPRSAGRDEGVRGTIMLDQYQGSSGGFQLPPSARTPAPNLNNPQPPPNPPPSGQRGTLMFDEAMSRGDISGRPLGYRDENGPRPGMAGGGDYSSAGRPSNMPGWNAPQPAPAPTAIPRMVRRLDELTTEPVLVSPQYSSASLQELQYLGQLLVRERQPVCPVNGVLTLIQFESIHSSPAEVEELQKAIRSDLATVQYAFKMRAPVTAMIVGLEKERGFRELVRRVGRDRATGQRFGRKFDVQAVPAESELRGLTAHLCGAFEDWAYALFREEDSLSRPGNTLLYELLSKVRCSWKERLSEILVGGFGCDPVKLSADQSVLFSGCYFAATGETPDRQAFVKGVIDKLNEEQELVEWTPSAKRHRIFQQRLAMLGSILTVLLALSLFAMIIYRRWFWN